MRGLRLELSPGAALAAALLLALLRVEELAALALALLIHELGHLAAILVLRQRLTGFRAQLGGFSLDYAGDASELGHALIAGAGPGAGLLYALAAARLGVALGRDWLCLSAGLSLLLSLLNLLPAPPLDGGRLCACLTRAALGPERAARLCRCLAAAAGVLLLGLGGAALLRGGGAGLALVGLWLLASSRGTESGEERAPYRARPYTPYR
jgi:Zn-dependent protease